MQLTLLAEGLAWPTACPSFATLSPNGPKPHLGLRASSPTLWVREGKRAGDRGCCFAKPPPPSPTRALSGPSVRSIQPPPGLPSGQSPGNLRDRGLSFGLANRG